MTAPKIAAVIPARMNSSRFPGKPLFEVRGLPMVEHVRRRAVLCRLFSRVVVATCDEEIARAVSRYGGEAVMTSPAHPAATDRVAEAAQHLDCTHVVNVQGDEILVLPIDLERMVRAIQKNPEGPAWNAVAPLDSETELGDPSIVKCAVSASDRILFCSRRFPYETTAWPHAARSILKVLGILGYRRDFLDRYRALSRTPLEQAESIDQSRILEHDIPLRAVRFSQGYIGINEPREVAVVQDCLDRDPLQQAVLEGFAS